MLGPTSTCAINTTKGKQRLFIYLFIYFYQVRQVRTLQITDYSLHESYILSICVTSSFEKKNREQSTQMAACFRTVKETQASFLKNSSLLYVHCVAKEEIDISLAHLTCVKMICREIHVSFVDKMKERPVALLPLVRSLVMRICAEFGGNCATCHKGTKLGGNDQTNVWTVFRYGASAKIKSN